MRGRQLLDRAAAEHGIVLAPRFEADSVEGLLMLVRTGPWAAVVPESAVRPRGDDPALRVLPIAAPEILMPIMLARLSDEPMSPLASAIDAAAARAFGGDPPDPS
jgi:DNA-binding transcriptional LysR family regulator